MMHRPKGLPGAASLGARLWLAGAMPARFLRAVASMANSLGISSRLSIMSGSKLGADYPHHAIGRADCLLGKGGETPSRCIPPRCRCAASPNYPPRHPDEGLAPSTRLTVAHD
jgi:hypothetical protein